MFKAFDTGGEREVISLDEEPVTLRALGLSDRLRCPECRQPVIPRTGELRQPHFAHRRLGDCSAQGESPARLRGRAALYRWLRERYSRVDPAARVTLEHRVELTATGPNPVLRLDCHVVTGADRRIGYWLMEATPRPERREAALGAFARAGVLVHVLWLRAPRTVGPGGESDHGRHLFLDTTQRALLSAPVHCPPSIVGSGVESRFLQFLAVEDAPAGSTGDPALGARLTTWRALTCIHPPQQHTGERREHPLAEVDLLALSGHLLHPGEREAARGRLLVERQRRRERREAETNLQRTRGEGVPAAHPRSLNDNRGRRARSDHPPRSRPEPKWEEDTGPSILTAKLLCCRCGIRQPPGGWTQARMSEGTCLCYACSRGNKPDRPDTSS